MSANSQPLIATIYNPHNQSKEALIAGFIARKQKFERLFRDIRDAPMTKPEQHYLIQGIRGMGKTTLLLRIAYEIENTPELHQRLLPIVFNEEEYGIGTLADVWERTAQYLGEADPTFANLYDTITNQYGQDEYESKVFQTLIEALRQQGKKLLLLIDNIGDLLKKLGTREEKRLREILLTTPELRLVGATSVAIEQVHDYTKPFYEFFKVIHLDGLNRQEAIDLFLKLGETYHNDAVKQLIEHQPGRIEAIRRLTGGVIRTMVLLFEILVENDSGSVFRDLNVLLDRVTPLYKHRLDDLPAQQQKIVAALAQAWDAASTKELAQVVRLESKVVSAQLKQLIDNNVVEKVETNTKNHLYRLEERFFNIWYLMRFGRKTDQRVLWLIRFFETMFEGDEAWMHERVDDHLKAMEIGGLDPEAALYLTTAFSRILKNEEAEDFLKRKTRIYLAKTGRNELVKALSHSKHEIVTQLFNEKKIKEALTILNKYHTKDINTYLDLATGYLLIGDKKDLRNSLIKMLLLTNSNDYTYTTDELIEKQYKPDSVIIGILLALFIGYLLDKSDGRPTKILAAKSYEDIAAELAIRNFMLKRRDRKWISLYLADRFIDSDYNSYEYYEHYESYDYSTKVLIIKQIILLWNNRVDTLSGDLYLYLDQNDKYHSDLSLDDLITSLLKLFLAKKQYHTTYNYFVNKDGNLKDRFKPLYYATLYFLQDEYPTEYLRMGPELKETVDDLLVEVAQMAIDYA